MSLRLAEIYGGRLLALSDRAEARARATWPTIDRLDGTNWPQTTARYLERVQAEGVRLTAAFLTASLRRNGLGRVDPPRGYVGQSRDGQPLPEALKSPIVGVLAALKDGRSSEEALQLGLHRAIRTVRFEAVQTPREALLSTVEADDRFEGFQRLTRGTCAACMALSGSGGPQFPVHPSCSCVPVPRVVGASALAIPTGAELFASKTREEQDASLGPEAAEAVRNGASLEDFVGHSHQDQQENFITQRPVEAVAT